jgi:hypothetical protein
MGPIDDTDIDIFLPHESVADFASFLERHGYEQLVPKLRIIYMSPLFFTTMAELPPMISSLAIPRAFVTPSPLNIRVALSR